MRLPDGYDDARRRARTDAQRRPAPARRDRPRAAGRSANPHARRRDFARRRVDRAADQGRAREAMAGARRSSSPTACRRSRWRTRSWCSRTARSPPRAPTTSCWRRSPVPRDRREGPARPGLPHAQPDRARGGRTVSADAATLRAATHRRAARQRPRPQAPRAAGVAAAVPRARAARCSWRWCAATAASLAPAPLAKTAIDSGIVAKRPVDARPRSSSCSSSARSSSGARATCRRSSSTGSASARCATCGCGSSGTCSAMPVGFFETRQTGVLISRMTNDVQALDSLVTDSVVTLFTSTLTLIGHDRDPAAASTSQLALLTFLDLPRGRRSASFLFRVVSADAYRRTRETIGAITAYLQETLSGIRVVRSFGAGAAAQDRVRRPERGQPRREHDDGQPQRRVLPGRRARRARSRRSASSSTAATRRSRATCRSACSSRFVAALNGFFDPIQQLSQVYTTYQSGMAALDKIFELLDVEPDLVDEPGAIELPTRPRRAGVPRRVVPYGARTAQYALQRHRRLSVPPGQTVALVGSTGAGKSTFAKLVARFYDPTEGARAARRPRSARRDAARRCARSSASCRRRLPVQRHDRARTSPSAGPTRRPTRSAPPRARSAPTSYHRRSRDGYDTADRRARRAASRRPAPAHRLRPRADRPTRDS